MGLRINRQDTSKIAYILAIAELRSSAKATTLRTDQQKFVDLEGISL